MQKGGVMANTGIKSAEQILREEKKNKLDTWGVQFSQVTVADAQGKDTSMILPDPNHVNSVKVPSEILRLQATAAVNVDSESYFKSPDYINNEIAKAFFQQELAKKKSSIKESDKVPEDSILLNDILQDMLKKLMQSSPDITSAQYRDIYEALGKYVVRIGDIHITHDDNNQPIPAANQQQVLLLSISGIDFQAAGEILHLEDNNTGHSTHPNVKAVTNYLQLVKENDKIVMRDDGLPKVTWQQDAKERFKNDYQAIFERICLSAIAQGKKELVMPTIGAGAFVKGLQQPERKEARELIAQAFASALDKYGSSFDTVHVCLRGDNPDAQETRAVFSEKLGVKAKVENADLIGYSRQLSEEGKSVCMVNPADAKMRTGMYYLQGGHSGLDEWIGLKTDAPECQDAGLNQDVVHRIRMMPTNDPLLQQVATKSLKDASTLQKYNNVLDQAIAYISSQNKLDGTNPILQTEGFLRLSGAKTATDRMHGQLLADPTSSPLSSFTETLSDPNSLGSLIKQMINDIKQEDISETAKEIFKNFSNDPNMSYQELIAKLKSEGAVEEAKLFHNILHLCNQVGNFENENKMVPSNLLVVFAPNLSRLIDPALFSEDDSNLSPAEKMNRMREEKAKQEKVMGQQRFISAVKDKQFSTSFSQSYPVEATKLSEAYKEYPPRVIPKKEASVAVMPKAVKASKSGFSPVSLLKRAGAWLSKPFKAAWGAIKRKPKESAPKVGPVVNTANSQWEKKREDTANQNPVIPPQVSPTITSQFTAVKPNNASLKRQEPLIAQARIAHKKEDVEEIASDLPPPDFGPPPPIPSSDTQKLEEVQKQSQKMGEQGGIVAQTRQKFEQPAVAPRDPGMRKAYMPDGGIAKSKVQELKQMFEKRPKTDPDDPDKTKAPSTRGSNKSG